MCVSDARTQELADVKGRLRSEIKEREQIELELRHAQLARLPFDFEIRAPHARREALAAHAKQVLRAARYERPLYTLANAPTE